MKSFILYNHFFPSFLYNKNLRFLDNPFSNHVSQVSHDIFVAPSTSQKDLAAKEEAPDEKTSEKKDLDEFMQDVNKNLFRVKSFFPLEFFPDELVIDQDKVSVIKNYFYLSKQIRNIAIGDIGDVMIETGPFFATLIILDKSSGNVQKEEMKVEFLHKDKAFKARRLIQGLIICKKETVDLSGHSTTELKKKIEEIGKTIEG